MTAFLDQAMPRSYEFYQSFLQSVVIPHAQIFGFLVAYGELLVGIALVLGITTRLAALAGIVMTLNYMLVKGATLWMASSNDAAFSFIGLVVMLGGAGRALGMDYFLARKWSKIPLW
jgi:thiosulfate dehydrogenase [quinone] large subunit